MVVNGTAQDRAAELDYDVLVKLRGTLTREWDMSFVNDDLGSMTDWKQVRKAESAAALESPRPGTYPRRAAPHLILHLKTPVSIRAGAPDGLHEEEKSVSEIDVTDANFQTVKHLPAGALNGAPITVTGKLWHGMTRHHLRPIMMDVQAVGAAVRK